MKVEGPLSLGQLAPPSNKSRKEKEAPSTPFLSTCSRWLLGGKGIGPCLSALSPNPIRTILPNEESKILPLMRLLRWNGLKTRRERMAKKVHMDPSATLQLFSLFFL